MEEPSVPAIPQTEIRGESQRFHAQEVRHRSEDGSNRLENPLQHKEQRSNAKEDSSRASSSRPRSHGGPGRKPRACQECKRQKMKCEVLPNDRKCKNCVRRNLECIQKQRVFWPPPTPSSNEENGRKIDTMRTEMQQIQQTLNLLLRQGAHGIATPAVTFQQPLPSPPPPQPLQSHLSPRGSEVNAMTTASDTALSTRDNMNMAMTRENSPDPPGNGDQAQSSILVTEPMGGLYEVTRLRNIRSNQANIVRPEADGGGQPDDFIARGVITEAEAEELYSIFHTSLNHYLWVGLEQIHASLMSVRRSSELLTATILTVTALHIPTSAETFDKCYKEFLSLISSSMFSRFHSIDDVRGLCIAAFWLSEVSWKLSGHAIRIATELNIHNSFYRALEGDSSAFLRARLWYMSQAATTVSVIRNLHLSPLMLLFNEPLTVSPLVVLYVCDHHFSIAYGRPPMISESVQIREHELFLQSPLADAIDRRILSQVALMQILTRIHECFAERRLPQQDPSGALLSESDFVHMRNFNLEIDQWRLRWHSRQQNNTYIGSFPPKGIILYSYFAKLQLNSFAVRGISITHGRLSTERKEFANMAISAAGSILTFVLEEDDMRRALVGTPLYVHTMIAFASVFLMKVTTKWNRIVGLNVEPTYVWGLLERMVVLLKSSVTSDRHLLYHIAAGLEKMLARSRRHGPGEVKASAVERGSYQGGYGSQYEDPQGAEMEGQRTASGSGHGVGGTPGSWDAAYAGVVDDGQRTQPGNDEFNHMTIMNDSLIYEAFGTESANDVYNLLTSQFSY